MKLNSDLREFVASSNSAGVEYLVVDGHAVSFHGYPRFTGDIDFWVRSTPDNARRILNRPPNRIDLLTAISGVVFDAAWPARQAGELDGLTVYFIGREDLLTNKRASGRLKDLADVEELEGT